MRLDDPAVVREEYADETRLAARKKAHASAEGQDARVVVFQAIADVSPQRILEVGCHFSRVDRIDVHGWFVFSDAAAAQAYVDSMVVLSGTVPPVEGPIRARRAPCVFVADK